MDGLLLPCHNLGATLAYHNLGLGLLSLKGPYKSELTSAADLPGFVLLTAGGASTGLGWGSYGRSQTQSAWIKRQGQNFSRTVCD